MNNNLKGKLKMSPNLIIILNIMCIPIILWEQMLQFGP